MKTFTKVSASLILAITYTITASAVPITFQVDTSIQAALGNFNPATDTVVVAGDPINSWSTTDSPLTSSTDNTNIWTGTFDVAGTTGTTVQYKYVLNTAGGLVWEGSVGPGGGSGNRTFTLPASAQTLSVVYFNNATNSASITNLVTFQVDLSVQTDLGNFDPSTGTMNVAGEFNSWSAAATPMTNSPTDTNIWIAVVSLSGGVNTSVAYKYIMSGTWEGNVGPGGSQNRSVTLQRTNQILPAVYFNNQAALPVPTPLAFQVDLATQIALGNFDPATGLVEARGSFNGWAGGFTLTNSPANTNIYSGTYVDTNDTVGGAIGYQFVLDSTTWETAVGNRNYTLTSTNQQTLPLVYFNNVNNLGSVTIGPVSAGQAALSWTPGPQVRLQTIGNLLSPTWLDVPNTQGSNSVTVPLGSSPQFYRLVGP